MSSPHHGPYKIKLFEGKPILTITVTSIEFRTNRIPCCMVWIISWEILRRELSKDVDIASANNQDRTESKVKVATHLMCLLMEMKNLFPKRILKKTSF
jgi:hypothetical protein